MSGLNRLSADGQIRIIQNNVDQWSNLTISSISDLHSQLDSRYQKTDTDSVLDKKEMYLMFNHH